MSKQLPKATYQGVLTIGDVKIPCAVLEDGTRILRERSVATALGKKGGGAYWERKKEKSAVLPEYVSLKILNPFIDDELRISLLNPIVYETTSKSTAQGINASLLTDICNIWLTAREKGALTPNQENTAIKAEILMRGFAKIGIIALVDEATGYQDFRARNALEKILEKYISEELNKWAKTFPDEFYKRMFELRGWHYNPMSVKRPSVIGKYTNDIVYERLAPGVLGELRKKNPKMGDGHRKTKHFQWLTKDVGHPRLREHIASVIVLMRASTTWDGFYRLLQRSLPKQNDTIELVLKDKTGDLI